MMVFSLAENDSEGLRYTRKLPHRGVHRLATAGVVGLLALGLWGCGRGEAAEAPSLQAEPVLREDMRITAEATGNVEPVREIEVKSKASGEVLRLHVDVGDEVQPGEVGRVARGVPCQQGHSPDRSVCTDEEVRQRRSPDSPTTPSVSPRKRSKLMPLTARRGVTRGRRMPPWWMSNWTARSCTLSTGSVIPGPPGGSD